MKYDSVVIVALLGALLVMDILIYQQGQQQAPVQVQEQAQAEIKQEPVWQLHGGDSDEAWRLNIQTGDVEYFYVRWESDKVQKKYTVKFPAPTPNK